MSHLIEIIVAFIGTLGFGFLFNIRGIKLFWASLGGMLCWIMFLALGPIIPNEPIRYLIVSICSTTYSEILARVLKTPASTFCLISLIPLVPGSALYYTTTSAFTGDMTVFVPKLIYTLELAVALSLGIVLVTTLFRQLSKIRKKSV